MSDKTVGFIGTGIMGKPMAANVLDAGYPVVAHNRSREPVEALVEQGAVEATSPAEVARQSDVVVTVLPDTEAVETVVLDEEGVIDGISEGQTVIDMSTISPPATEDVASALEELGVSMLDAPVSGGEEGAIEGTLSIMVGGDESILDDQRDILEVMGETITYCGDNGMGQVTKACNQMIVSVTLQAISEALVFAQKAGADLEAVVDAVSGGAASCWALDNRAPQMIRGYFEPGFFASYQYKDLRIASEAGEAYGAPMPATELAHEMYKAVEERGHGRESNAAVIKIIEELAGEEARIDDEWQE